MASTIQVRGDYVKLVIMDMWIPLQIPSKGMEHHDKSGSEIQGLVLLVKHLGNNTVHGMKEAVEQCPVIKEKLAEIPVNGKNTVAVGDVDQFKGHRGSTLHGIEIPAGGAESAVAPEGYEFELSTSRTAVHCPAKGGGAAVDHFIHVFNNRSAWM